MDALAPSCPVIYMMMTRAERDKDIIRSRKAIKRTYLSIMDEVTMTCPDLHNVRGKEVCDHTEKDTPCQGQASKCLTGEHPDLNCTAVGDK